MWCMFFCIYIWWVWEILFILLLYLFIIIYIFYLLILIYKIYRFYIKELGKLSTELVLYGSISFNMILLLTEFDNIYGFLIMSES